MSDLVPHGRTPFSMFTTAEATAMGLDRKALHRLRRAKAIEPVCRGVHAVGESHLSEIDRHVRLVWAGSLLYPDARASHASALVLRGIPVWPAPPTRADLVRPGRHEVLTQSFRLRPLYGSADELDGLALCDLASTLVHYTMDAGPTAGVIAADDALRRQLVSPADLQTAHEAIKGRPHSGRCQMMRNLVDGRRESVGESRLAILAAVAGIRLVPQVTIHDVDGEIVARVDFVVEGTKVVIEFDGKLKYADGGADALFAEKRREDRLRRLGYIVVRVTWGDLEHPQRVIGWIRSALQAA